MVEVELVDLEVAGRPRPAPAVPRRGAPTAPRAATAARQLRRGAVLALVTALAVTTAAIVRGDGEEQTLLGGAPTLTSPLSATWRVETRAGWAVVHGLLLTPDPTAEGVGMTAYDVGDGSVRWTLPPRRDALTLECPVGIDGGEGPVVVCQALGHLAPADNPGGGRVQDPGSLLLLDAATGTVVEELALSPAHRGFGALDGDLVLATARPDGVEVVRRDVTGRAAWTTRVPLEGGGSDHGPSARVEVTDGGVLVSGSATTLLGTDGAALGSWGRGPNSPATATWPEVSTTPVGVGVRVDQTDRTAPTTWFAPDGELLGEFPGAPAEPAISDGTVPEVVLALTPGWGTLRGLDVAADRTVWTADLGRQRPVLRSDGAVVVAGDGVVRALDLATGAERWRAEPAGVTRVHPVSDGSFVLATGRTRGGPQSLTALSLSDGSVLWRSPMPAGTTSVAVHDGQMVAVGPGLVVGLG